MYFLFSGEGPTDFGVGTGDAVVCEDRSYEYGPMAVVVDHIVEARWKYSLLESHNYGFVREHTIVERASELKNVSRKSFPLPGKKKPKETAYFYENARVLALCAKEKEEAIEDEVIAVLFRDSDGTASAGRGLWQDKWKSMLAGFEREQFPRGVPMIPKPKSEAWVICALRENPYQGCNALEDRSGNDNSPKSLKVELKELHGYLPSREELRDLVEKRTINIGKIKMPSFTAFRSRLEDVLEEN